MLKERWGRFKEYAVKEGDFYAISVLIVAGISIALVNQVLAQRKKR